MSLKNETIADIMTEIVGRDAACRQPVTDCHGLNAAAQAAEDWQRKHRHELKTRNAGV